MHEKRDPIIIAGRVCFASDTVPTCNRQCFVACLKVVKKLQDFPPLLQESRAAGPRLTAVVCGDRHGLHAQNSLQRTTAVVRGKGIRVHNRI
ncbi:conserved hypothetical protein [Coccidioides posadasii str. Silveira]|uniref:Uncharacterized protein n=1 Tax=Coccidioides posadasii (strain RMSCC 757 / Silveira) TaxID=443226 RepID=E9DGM0_COCPS|nr:conserved hypothetical protein [Coccidioides posadasii str. Silveira]